jgi:hypothetical protein
LKTQTIELSAGAVERTFPVTITELTGKDISGDPVWLSLGTETLPGAWVSPDVDIPQSVKSQRVVQLLVGGVVNPGPGVYWLWSKVTDNPEIVPRRQLQVVLL